MEEYKARLIAQIQSIEQWNDDDAGKIAVKKFMNAIGTLYLDYYQFHLEEAKTSILNYKFLLEKAIWPLILYTIHLEHELTSCDHSWKEPWDIACKGRTNIEAFNLMFSELTESLDTSGIDEYIQYRGDVFMDPDLIPKNVPATHFWWFKSIYLNLHSHMTTHL